MRALVLRLLLAVAQVHYTRAQQQACAAGAYWNASASACSDCAPGFYQPLTGQTACTACAEDMNTSAPGARSVVQCTCPPGTGLEGEGYGGGCSACAPGSYAPDAGPAFEFVGEGTCTGTCAHTKILDSEGACGLECVKRPGCVGFAYTYNTSACELHWAAPREIEASWSVVHSHDECSWIAGSAGTAGQACWRKNISNAQLSGISKDLHAQDYTFVGDGDCRGSNRLYVFFANSFALSTHDLCRKACTKDVECIGYSYSSSDTQCWKLYAHKHTTNYDVLFQNSNHNWQFDYDIAEGDGNIANSNTLCYRKSVHEPLSCLPCARGTAQAATGQAACDSCAAVGFQNDTKQHACTECQGNKSAYYAHSVDATDCVCTAAFSTSATGECMPCEPQHYSPNPAHEYQLLGEGVCTQAEGAGINARIVFGVDDASCRDMCDAWSTCTGYEMAGTGSSASCRVFGDFVDVGLPEFRMTSTHIPGQWYAQPYWNSQLATGVQAGEPARCYSRGLRPAADRECQACPAENLTAAFVHAFPRCACPAGTFHDLSSAGGECVPCAAGTFQDKRGQEQCELCPVGTYQAHTGRANCTGCPESMNTSAPGARSIVLCTCPPGTGLGVDGYGGGCSACAPGSYAPDAGPAFAFVGKGSCTGTCVHEQTLDSEGDCALACVNRSGCVGFAYTHASSRCELHWAQPRATEVGWAAVGPGTACAGINGSTGGEGQACWQKHATHPHTQLANLLNPPMFELVGDGYCRSAPGLRTYYLYRDDFNDAQCRQSCEQENECIGFMYAEDGAFMPGRCYIFFGSEKTLQSSWIKMEFDAYNYSISLSTNQDFGRCYRRHQQPAYENLGAGYCRGASNSYPYALLYHPFTEALCQRTCDLEDGCIGYMFAESGTYENTCYLYFAFARGAFGVWTELNRATFELSGVSGHDVGYCYRRNARPALACIACAPGSFQAAEAQTACAGCGSGGYAPARGHRRCVECLETRQSAYAGAVSKQACLCAPGYESAQDGTCASCDSRQYSALGVHSYEDKGFGHCRSPLGENGLPFEVNARFAGNITQDECEAECDRQSSCVGYTFSTHRQPGDDTHWHERCWVHGEGLAHGLLHWQTAPAVPGAWRANATAHLVIGEVSSVADEGEATRCYQRLPLAHDRTCEVCPGGTSAPQGAVAVTECTCQAGYARANATSNCTLCPSGTYSPGNATGACITCPDPTRQTSPAGSTSAGDCTCVNTATETLHDGMCVCQPGHGRASNASNCTQCRNGTYSPGNTTSECTVCPENMTSPIASTAQAQCYCRNQNETRDPQSEACVCARGFGRASPGAPCTLCAMDTYDTDPSTDDCTPCAPGLTSPVGSTGADNCTCARVNEELDASGARCMCLAGYGRANATSACLPCGNGTFSAENDSDACHPCPLGATSPPLSTSANNCSCASAYEELDASGARCLCLPGYGRANAPSACLPCANGTFSGASGNDTCLACPVGATSPPLSTSVGNCSCQPGYGRADGSANCSECPEGTYGPSGGDERCESCPATLSSPARSADAEACGCSDSADTGGTSACVCPPGYGFDSARRCIQCLVGSYGPGVEAGKCEVCPANMTTLVDDARSLVDCVCLPGHGMTAAGYEGGCTPCAAGNFQPGEHVNFEYLGTGNCTSTCANWREMADEGECALVCAGRVDCTGYSHGTPVDSNVSRCILYFRDERTICDGWEPVRTDGQCDVLNASGDTKSMSCRQKNSAAPAFGYTSLNDVEVYENIGNGSCQAIGGQEVYFYFSDLARVSECEQECTKLHECIGYNIRYNSHCRLYMLFLAPDARLYKRYEGYTINRCGNIYAADGDNSVGQCMRKKRRQPLSCIACDTGTAQEHEAQDACDLCSSTSFSSKRGSQTCESCPMHTEKSEILGQSLSACRCTTGFHFNDGQECTPCPEGLFSLLNSSSYTRQAYDSHDWCYRFAVEKAANRGMHIWKGLAVQVADNVSMAVCQDACERYSACIGYHYVVELSSTNILTSHCTLFPNASNMVLSGTLPMYESVTAGYQGWAIVVSSEVTRYFTPIDGTVVQEHCYTRELSFSTCHACPLGGRAPPGSGSEAACVLTRALPAGLNASAWRALGEGVLLDPSAVELNVQRYNKHEISKGYLNEGDIAFEGTISATYTCVNITAGIGPLEAQAPRQTLSFRTSDGQATQVLLQEPYARAKAAICGIKQHQLIFIKSEFTALDAEFNLLFYVGDASAPPSATVTPLRTPDREARPHVHAHGHNVSLWGVGGPRGVTVLHDYTHDLVYTFARNLTRASVGAVHRNSTAASADTGIGLWLWAHDAGGNCIEYVHNKGRETVQALRLPLPANASVQMLAPDPSNTWVLCVLRQGTQLLVLDIHTRQSRQVVGLQPTQYVHAVFAHSVSYIYVAYTPGPPPAVTDNTQAEWVRYRLDMQQYMVQVQLPVAAEYPPALCAPGSSRDLNVGVCVACAQGMYKNWTGDEGCLPCGPDETTRELGADAREKCLCKRGFGRPNRNTGCVLCAAGEFKHRIGNVPCTACLEAHALASGGDGALCACASGWYFDAVGDAAHCLQCPRNTYKQENGTGPCTACGAHMHTLATASKHAHDCLCDGGHGLGRGATVHDQIWSFEHISSLEELETYFGGDGNISHGLDSVSSTASDAGSGAQWQAAGANGKGYMSFVVQAPYTHALVHVGNCAQSSTVVVELQGDGSSRLAEVGAGRNKTVCFPVAAENIIKLEEAGAAICLSSRVHLSTQPVPDGECTYTWSATPPPDYACAACAPGSYAPGETRQLCALCAQGHYAEHPAQSACTQCPDGFFAERSGARECELCVFPNATTADRSACAAVPDATGDADACANETVVPLDEYVRLRREDFDLKTLAELEHSPGGLPHTQV